MIHLQVAQSVTVSSLQHLLCHQAAIVLVREFAMEAEELTQLPFHPFLIMFNSTYGDQQIRRRSSFSESLESAPAIHPEDSPISSVRSHEDFRLLSASESPTVKTIPDDVCSSFDPVCAASKDDEDELFSNVVVLQDSHRLRGLGFKAAIKPKIIETSQMETISTADLSLSTRARTDSTDDVVTNAVAPSDIAQILLAADADVDVEPNGDVKSSGVDVDVISVSSTVGPSIISNGFSTAHVSKFDTVRFITNLKLRQNRPSSTSNVDNVRFLILTSYFSAKLLITSHALQQTQTSSLLQFRVALLTATKCSENTMDLLDPVLVVRGSINTAY
ncbi:hypothetical protein ALC62_11272 [Cyphomyrmex costatus]|uniref:Uncharacterized protein n=1 Tax=Cyphomyrmex costatus TaxID=456900 RepID=A0A195CCH3_9HYME|nr:hypothetical protein ALC62_11272 [Cyphomyrmex costatus]